MKVETYAIEPGLHCATLGLDCQLPATRADDEVPDLQQVYLLRGETLDHVCVCHFFTATLEGDVLTIETWGPG